ncbi:MAG: hypothetical protein Q9166_001667 [cf. Caloplaca sp. 2 TL-2023]
MAESLNCCSLCWSPPDLGQADDDWVYCDGSPCRNLDSPLDQRDLERFEITTAELGASTRYPDGLGVDSLPSIPRLESLPEHSNYHLHEEALATFLSLTPTLSDQQWLVAVYRELQEHLARLESSVEDFLRPFEIDLMEIRKQLTKLGEAINSIGSESNSTTLTEDFYNGNATDHETASAVSQPERYVQNWRRGGLIIVENLSEHARLRDIHALFQSCGSITYLELHGADKSNPHINTRHAYIHFAEYRQAIIAREEYHGFEIQNMALMVFLLDTSTVRGEPGKPYVGDALEILNFSGGPNYASPQADCLQNNKDLETLLQGLKKAVPLQQPAASTYSLQPNLTSKTASSWRRTSVSSSDVTATSTDDESLPRVTDHKKASLVEANLLPVRQPGAYIPPIARKRKSKAIIDTNDTTPRQRRPLMKVLKRGEPLPSESFELAMIHRADFKSERLDVEDLVVFKGKGRTSGSRKATTDDDAIDEEEGGVRLP